MRHYKENSKQHYSSERNSRRAVHYDSNPRKNRARPTEPQSQTETHQERNSLPQKYHRSQSFKVDFKRLHRFGFITDKNRRSRISEEIRLIKRRLINRMDLQTNANNRRKNRNRTVRGREHVIVITSSKPSEGKSFIATNLALSIALDEKLNVLLIDADVTRPALSKIFGIPPRVSGLTDLLSGHIEKPSEVILRSNEHPLAIIPAGQDVISATNLFGSEFMEDFVTDIATRYTDRIIIFDAPPLLASTEALVLAQHAGQVVLVIDALKTSRKAIDSALDLLPTEENVNMILNKIEFTNANEQFGSYYEAYTQNK